MLYAAMLDHVSLPFEKKEVGDLLKSSSSQKNGNGELLVLSIKAIKQPPGLCLLVSTVEHIRFILLACLNGILLKQCLGWQLLGERY